MKVGREKGGRRKEARDIIADAFNPIECTTWKMKNLVDQIEEDHPSARSTEYALINKASSIPPIGKGIPERNKARYISLSTISPESTTSLGMVSETKKQIFLDEMQSFARKRGVVASASSLICAISKDQEGSRFVQKKLDTATTEEVKFVFQEVQSWLSDLITDLFGNYVIQKLLEVGQPSQREEILRSMEPSIISLSLHMYGCRVVQKALECKDINERIVSQLKGHVVDLVCDQNGNHVIQKCVECIRSDFIIREFENDVVNLSRHRYGCRVIQRIFENSANCTVAIEKIIASARFLVEDQYGNYVIQHILEQGTEAHKRRIITDLLDRIEHYSTHKFASNVMEKCVVCGTPENRRQMLQHLIRSKPETGSLSAIACDKFGNYVVQRMIEVLSGKDKEVLMHYLKAHIQDLKKSTYAKCILSKLNGYEG